MKALLLTLLLIPFVSTFAAARQDPAPVDNRPEVKAAVDKLAGHASKRGKEDVQAIATIDQLLQEFPKSGPKDRALIVKGLDKCFTEKRQEDDNNVRDNKLYLSAATALGEMAPESVPVLLSWIGNKAHAKDTDLQKKLILVVGKTKHLDAREPLIKLLLDKDPQLVAAAAEALGNYAEIDQKLRKATFEELLKGLTSAKNAVDSDANDTIARDRYDVISAPMVTSLQRLSGADVTAPDKWQTWWNKNKKEDWDQKK
jgi:HEAT repeat protein